MFATATATSQVQNSLGDFAKAGLRMARKPNRTEAKREIQARQRDWLRSLINTTGLAPSALANGAGVSESTLTRLVNKRDYTGTLSPETVERIVTAYRVPGPEGFQSSLRRGGAPAGFSEAAPVDFSGVRDELALIVKAILRGRNDVHTWRLQTTALEGAGFLPGDLVFVQEISEGQMPRAKDAVCAQVVDYQRGMAETVWRIYDPPFLVGAGLDRTAYKPLIVDNERVKVAGIITESFRPLAAGAASR